MPAEDQNAPVPGRSTLPDPAQLYRVLAETAPDAIITIDEGSIILSVNPAAERIFGYTSGEMLGQPLYMLMPERFAQRHGSSMARYVSTGVRSIPWRGIRVPVRTKAGDEIPVEISFGEFIAEGRRIFSGFIRDISTQVAAERTLADLAARADLARHAAEDSERRASRLQAVTSALAGTLSPTEVARVIVENGIAGLGARAGAVAMLNESGSELTLLRSVGYPEDAVERFRTIPIGASFPLADAVREGEPIFLADGSERATRYPHLARLREANGGGPMAAIPLAVDGRAVGVLGINFSDGVVLDGDGREFLRTLAQQCALALDRARLYEAERKARTEADAANQAKSQFLAVMSHELRTPLNAIAGYAALMQAGVPEPVTGGQQDYLMRIQHAQGHLLTLINSVLDFARIEAGHVDLSLATVTIANLIARVEPLIGPQLRAKNQRFTIRSVEAALAVRADAEKAAQILVNLIGNAVKFTPAEGSISVDAEVRGDAVAIHVEDSGIGIPGDRIAAIFEPFVQVDKRFTRANDGVGLGLAISRDLARAMGGDIAVRSTLGEGSVFTLTLPRPE